MDPHVNDELQNELDARIKDMFQVLDKMIDNMHRDYAEVLRQDLLQHPTTKEIVTELDYEVPVQLEVQTLRSSVRTLRSRAQHHHATSTQIHQTA